jgi:hypothetical protein
VRLGWVESNKTLKPENEYDSIATLVPRKGSYDSVSVTRVVDQKKASPFSVPAFADGNVLANWRCIGRNLLR